MSKEIEQRDTRVVYENRWMRLREDRIVRADGQEGIYSVVEKPDFAIVAALDARGLHLVEQFRYPVGGRYWEFPQGTSERSVDDPMDLARAELREETGLAARSMQHVAHVFLAYGLATQGYDIWFATGLEDGEPELEAEEQGLISRAFPVAQVERMVLDGVIKDAATICAFGLLCIKGLLPSA